MTDLVPDSLYSVLGVGSAASVQDIRSAYKKSALNAHPDKGGSKESFQRVVHAFETLSSARERERYDRRCARIDACGSNTTSKRRRQVAKATVGRTTEREASPLENVPVRMQPPDQSSKQSLEFVSGGKPSSAASSSNVEHEDRNDLHGKQPTTGELAQLNDECYKALTILQSVIASIQRDRRQLALDSLSMLVRRALLRHMNGLPSKQSVQPETHDASSIALPDDISGGTSTISSDLESLSDPASSDVEELLCLKDSDAFVLDSSSEFSRSLQPSGESVIEVKPEPVNATLIEDEREHTTWGHCRQPLSGCKGVLRVNHHAGNIGAYRANVVVQNLGIISDIIPSLSRAIELHAMLVQVKQHILETDQSKSFELRLEEALASVCEEHKVSPDVLGNAFSAIVSCYSFVGGNIKSRYTQEVDAALDARRRLLQGKAKGWSRLREEWVRLLQLPVKASKLTGRALQAPCSLEEATRKVDAAWERYGPRRKAVEAWQRRVVEGRCKNVTRHLTHEDKDRLRMARSEARRLRDEKKLERQLRKEQRRVTRAANRVGIVLKRIERFQNKARRKAMLEDSKTKALQAQEARRLEQKWKERWRWERDRSRTLEEIMHRPA